MTRESRARWLAFATAAVVVLLSALFAFLRNVAPLAEPRTAPAAQTPAAPAAAAAVPDPARLAAGRAAFERMNCALCHSVAGRGNPSHPLDGVGSRLPRDSLRDFSFGLGAAAHTLPGGIVQMKKRAVQDADVDALLDYLEQLR
jgi:mono/diheme cytochrome c family protein